MVSVIVLVTRVIIYHRLVIQLKSIPLITISAVDEKIILVLSQS